MASRSFLFLVLFASTVSVILSIPQHHILPVNPAESVAEQEIQQEIANELNADNIPAIKPRTFGDLFNLSAYLADAPNNTAALNFIPLITILSAIGG